MSTFDHDGRVIRIAGYMGNPFQENPATVFELQKQYNKGINNDRGYFSHQLQDIEISEEELNLIYMQGHILANEIILSKKARKILEGNPDLSVGIFEESEGQTLDELLHDRSTFSWLNVISAKGKEANPFRKDMLIYSTLVGLIH